MSERTTLSRHGRRQRGALAVEAAFVLPVVIAVAMMVIELAHIALAINMGASAMERAIQQFRKDSTESLQPDRMEAVLRQRMAAASHGYLAQDNFAMVNVEGFVSLDGMGGGAAEDADATAEAADTNDTDVPAWRITVDIRKEFITPLPRLLSLDSGAFRYRYEQVLAYLPARETAP